eukprot:gnl/TRDRNA2_/TRDRNA2_82029_c0_seq1.p1 gnl/TRDRNA2_/TRDRNA2_82029_c0~~gnl/TRDRNA2_/TRDRNA2_82029_c0_seq1.p1  ORF type:complete len:285 (+),score=32.18 gnl/TRDRNA2_/TRDRNA2_82029_c0_seq1:41-895(+)
MLGMGKDNTELQLCQLAYSFEAFKLDACNRLEGLERDTLTATALMQRLEIFCNKVEGRLDGIENNLFSTISTKDAECPSPGSSTDTGLPSDSESSTCSNDRTNLELQTQLVSVPQVDNALTDQLAQIRCTVEAINKMLQTSNAVAESLADAFSMCHDVSGSAQTTLVADVLSTKEQCGPVPTSEGRSPHVVEGDEQQYRQQSETAIRNGRAEQRVPQSPSLVGRVTPSPSLLGRPQQAPVLRRSLHKLSGPSILDVDRGASVTPHQAPSVRGLQKVHTNPIHLP